MDGFTAHIILPVAGADVSCQQAKKCKENTCKHHCIVLFQIYYSLAHSLPWQCILCYRWDLNWTYLEYKSEALLCERTCSVSNMHITRQAMHIQHNIVACSCSNSCNGNAIIYSPCIVVHINAAVKYVKVFSTATKMKQWVPFPLLSIYKIFNTAISDVSILRFSHKVPDMLIWF